MKHYISEGVGPRGMSPAQKLGTVPLMIKSLFVCSFMA